MGNVNECLRFVQRIFRNYPSFGKETFFEALVRSLLDYCASVWNPLKVTRMQSIEMIRHKTARFIWWAASVNEMLHFLNWESLHLPRDSDLASAIFNCISKVEDGSFLQSSEGIPRNNGYLLLVLFLEFY